MSRFLLLLWALILMAACSSPPDTQQQNAIGYSFDEMMAAYSAGQFRVIHTNSTPLYTSPAGKFVIASGGGMYRVSDGAFSDSFDQSLRFSPTGEYAWHIRDGIYRMSDMKRIIVTELVEEVGEDRIILSGDVEFSDNGEYALVTGKGVYRLSDGQQIIASDARYMQFSPDSGYVSTFNGEVFRLSDRKKLFELSLPSRIIFPDFSPDSAYIAADGVYRLSDQVQLFAADPAQRFFFTPDMQYVIGRKGKVHRLSDGEYLYNLDAAVPDFTLPNYSPNHEYMAIQADGVYRIADGEKLFDFGEPLCDLCLTKEAIFSLDSSIVVISSDGAYRLSDRQKLFAIGSDATRVYFSPDSRYLIADDVYRVADGQKILDRDDNISFFYSNEYIALNYDGVYRFEDGQKLFDLEVSLSYFSPNDTFAYSAFRTFENGVYRIPGGHHYVGLYILDVKAGVMSVGNTVIVIDPTQSGQRLPFVHVQQDTTAVYDAPNSGHAISEVIGAPYYMSVHAMKDGWYQVSYQGQTGWIPATAGTIFYVPE